MSGIYIETTFQEYAPAAAKFRFSWARISVKGFWKAGVITHLTDNMRQIQIVKVFLLPIIMRDQTVSFLTCPISILLGS